MTSAHDWLMLTILKEKKVLCEPYIRVMGQFHDHPLRVDQVFQVDAAAARRAWSQICCIPTSEYELPRNAKKCT